MNIYVHSKVAIIDDKWATIGTANLDGSGLNFIEMSDVVKAALREKVQALLPVATWGITLWAILNIFLSAALAGVIVGALIVVVAAAILLIKVDEPSEIPALLEEAIKSIRNTTQHANPFQEFQPSRHVELNIVIYNGVAGLPATDEIKDFREKLWREHLGLEEESPFPDEPAEGPGRPSRGWLKLWQEKADAKIANIKANAQLEPGQIGSLISTNILEWKAETSAKEYLKAHGVDIEDKKFILTIRDKADEFNYVTGKWEKNEY